MQVFILNGRATVLEPAMAKKVFDNKKIIEPFSLSIHNRVSTGLPKCENEKWRVFRGLHEDGSHINILRNKSIKNIVVMLDTHLRGYEKFLSGLTEFGKSASTVHMSGLGLGTMIPVILSYPNIKELNVVELSNSLIDLIGPFYESYISEGRLQIHCADAMEWRPEGNHYDIAFHDIWTSHCKKGNVKILKKYIDFSNRQYCWYRK